MKFLVYFALIFTVSLNAQAWKWPKLGGGKKSSPGMPSYWRQPTKVTTLEGCKLYHPLLTKEGYSIPDSSWLGKCQAGFAEGFGWFFPHKFKGIDSIPIPVFLEFKAGKLVGNLIYFPSGGLGFRNLLHERVACESNSQCLALTKAMELLDLKKVYKTTNNCEFIEKSYYYELPNPGRSYYWSGKCVNGKAEGIGWIHEYTLADKYNSDYSRKIGKELIFIVYRLSEFSNGVRSNPYSYVAYENPKNGLQEYRQNFQYLFIDKYGQSTGLKESDCTDEACETIKKANALQLPNSPEDIARQRLANSKGDEQNSNKSSGGPVGSCDDKWIGDRFDEYINSMPRPVALCDSSVFEAKAMHYIYRLMVKYCVGHDDQKNEYKRTRDQAANAASNTCVNISIQYDEPQ